MSRFLGQPVALLNFDTSYCDTSFNNGCDMTFYAVNFRNLLGALYNEFEFFNIMCINIAVSSNSFGSTTGDRYLYMSMNGLNWLGGMYSVVNKSLVNDVILTYFNTSTSAPTLFNYGNNNILTFRKTPVCDINFKIRKVTGLLPNTSVNFPETIFNFAIWGAVRDGARLLTIPTLPEDKEASKKQSYQKINF